LKFCYVIVLTTIQGTLDGLNSQQVELPRNGPFFFRPLGTIFIKDYIGCVKRWIGVNHLLLSCCVKFQSCKYTHAAYSYYIQNVEPGNNFNVNNTTSVSGQFYLFCWKVKESHYFLALLFKLSEASRSRLLISVNGLLVLQFTFTETRWPTCCRHLPNHTTCST